MPAQYQSPFEWTDGTVRGAFPRSRWRKEEDRDTTRRMCLVSPTLAIGVLELSATGVA